MVLRPVDAVMLEEYVGREKEAPLLLLLQETQYASPRVSWLQAASMLGFQSWNCANMIWYSCSIRPQ